MPTAKRPNTERVGPAIIVTVATALYACASPTESPTTGPAPAAPSAPPPNIVVVMTDDLDVPTTEELHDLSEMMADQGLSFTRAFVAQPLCGPSRASFFTGQYVHNHGVRTNLEPEGGFTVFLEHESSTVATWLQAAGYRTSLMGKYINGYPTGRPAEYIPPGWDDWYGHLAAFEDDKYYNYFINDNGQVVWHGAQPEDYSTDDLTRRAVAYVHDAAAHPEPFFLYLGLEAPHSPATYRDRHGGEFRDAGAPRSPSFNEPDVSDKPWGVRRPYLTREQIDNLDSFQIKRLRSMRPVEELIAQVLQALDQTGQLADTYLFFTSDNGLLMGQHRIMANKRSCYEEAIKVPLIVRGPGVRAGATDGLVSNIDLAPTFLELAGAPIPDSVDGRSFVPLLRGEPPRDRDVFAVWHASGLTAALRTSRWAYIENETSEIELYDMESDPYQVESLHWDADPALLQELHERFATLLACQGASCRD